MLYTVTKGIKNIHSMIVYQSLLALKRLAAVYRLPEIAPFELGSRRHVTRNGSRGSIGGPENVSEVCNPKGWNPDWAGELIEP